MRIHRWQQRLLQQRLQLGRRAPRRRWRLLQPLRSQRIRSHTRVGHVAQREREHVLARARFARSQRLQLLAQTRRIPAFRLPVVPIQPRGRNGLRRCAPQYQVEAVAAEFVVRETVARQRLDQIQRHIDVVRPSVHAAGQRRRIEQQLAIVRRFAVRGMTQRRCRRGRRGALQCQTRCKRGQQRQAAQIAQEQGAARCQAAQRHRHHMLEIRRTREVLRHRVEDHQIEILRQIVDLVRGALQQFHARQNVAARVQLPLHVRQRGRREVGAQIAFARRRQAQQQHAGAAAQFQHALRMQRAQAADGAVQPFAHVSGRNLLAVETPRPTDDIEIAGVVGIARTCIDDRVDSRVDR